MTPLQQELLSMYKDIKEVLESEKIRFYGIYGTALGAVRENGMVPWDDDIDLGVFEEDLPKVNEALSKKLDQSEYYYHIPSADTHPHVFKRTDNFESDLKEKKAPFIDIFVIERFPSKGLRRSLSRINVRPYMLAMSLVYIPNSNVGQKLVRWIPKVIKRCNKILVDSDSNETVLYEEDYKKTFHCRCIYGVPFMHKFEDTEMPIPEKWDEMLTSMYGDYMTPPPEDKRQGATGYPHRAYQDYLRDSKHQAVGQR